MSVRQQEYILNVQKSQVQADLPFTPSEIYVINNTSNPLYIWRGSLQTPSEAFYTYKVNGQANGIAGSVKLPTNANQFGLYLPTTPTLTDLLASVQVIFRGSNLGYPNYLEFELNQYDTKKK